DKRGHTVSVRLNDAELARLDSQRDAVQMQRGEYLRAALHLHCITLRIKPRKLGIVEAHRNGMPALVRGVERR
ncbi:hypothetical protein, partial [Aeromonas caviae]|uniref:hypothetical protein n=1 Tax=Aeromonas caviae TaxID=648 RepID=UPI001CC36B3B